MQILGHKNVNFSNFVTKRGEGETGTGIPCRTMDKEPGMRCRRRWRDGLNAIFLQIYAVLQNIFLHFYAVWR